MAGLLNRLVDRQHDDLQQAVQQAKAEAVHREQQLKVEAEQREQAVKAEVSQAFQREKEARAEAYQQEKEVRAMAKAEGSYPLSDNRRRGMRRVPSHA